MNNTFLTGQNALVTGGTRGIGLAVAEALARRGRERGYLRAQRANREKRSKPAHQKAKGKVVGKVADVRSNTEVATLFAWSISELGDLDILVNNAGVGVFKSTAELSVEDWQKTLETNLSGVFYCCREALPQTEATRRRLHHQHR